MIENILIRDPVDKTAAIVTGQKGCEEDITPLQRREILLLRIKYIEQELKGLPKNHSYRVALGEEKFSINKQLKKQAVGSLENYIIDECKSRLSSTIWDSIVNEARRKRDRDIVRERRAV